MDWAKFSIKDEDSSKNITEDRLQKTMITFISCTKNADYAAIFQSPYPSSDDQITYYFTPEAVTLFPEFISKYNATPCEKPPIFIFNEFNIDLSKTCTFLVGDQKAFIKYSS